MPDPKVSLSLQVPVEVYEGLKIEAQRQDISVSNLLRTIIHDWQIKRVDK